LNLEKLSFIERAFRARDCTCVEEVMKQFGLGVIVAAGLTLPAFAQASLKDQLVGTWTLASCNAPNFAPCAGSNGIQVFDANGHYVTMIAARGRLKITSPNSPDGANRANLHRSNTSW
jgi:hypothetical protein